MADFKIALENTLKNEGGYSNYTDDPGGETYKGISRRNNPNWPGWIDIDLAKHKPNFKKKIGNNKELDNIVDYLYREMYWDVISGDDIENQKVSCVIFDFAVNTGTVNCIKLLQNNLYSKFETLRVDGIMGPKTLNVLNANASGIVRLNVNGEEYFLNQFKNMRMNWYLNLCKKNNKLRKFLYGWLIRATRD